MGVNTTYLKFDDKQILGLFKDLTGPELKKAGIIALRKSGNILKKQTEANFKATGVNIALRTKYEKKTKKGKTVKRVKSIAALKVVKKNMEVKVHIMSNYMVKWFETGTNERHTEGYSYRRDDNRVRRRVGRWGFFYQRKGKGRRTGRIKAYKFFHDAQIMTKYRIINNIDNEIGLAIVKIYSKKRR